MRLPGEGPFGRHSKIGHLPTIFSEYRALASRMGGPQTALWEVLSTLRAERPPLVQFRPTTPGKSRSLQLDGKARKPGLCLSQQHAE